MTYQPGQAIKLMQNLTLYAQWEFTPLVSPRPEIDPVMAGDSTVSGTGSPGCNATVTLPNGAQIEVSVAEDDTWVISVPTGLTLVAGQVISATQTCPGMVESSPATIIVQLRSSHTVTGYVSPLVVDDLGFGPNFLQLFDIIVELRTSFLVPAPPELVTVAVPVDAEGLGLFTFLNVPNGDYVLYIKRPGYLVRSMNVTITAADPDDITLAPPGPDDNGVFNLWSGDVDGSTRVDNSDLIMILEGYGAVYPQPAYGPNKDQNADGVINEDDFQFVYLFGNYTVRDYPGAGDVDFYN